LLIEELCLDIIESCRYDKLTQAEQERLYTILCHDIAMAAVGGKTDFARSLLDPNLLVEAGSLRGTGDRSTYTLIGRDDRSLSVDMAADYLLWRGCTVNWRLPIFGRQMILLSWN
jgi:hypothetical protein